MSCVCELMIAVQRYTKKKPYKTHYNHILSDSSVSLIFLFENTQHCFYVGRYDHTCIHNVIYIVRMIRL